MPITDLLERNSKLYGDEIALVEINPEVQEPRRVSWQEYELIQSTSSVPYRREITWSIFDEKANRVANMLLGRGIRQGQKVAILLMNCLEWLPIYFGILKTGAIAVPLNFRYTSEEIEYCLDKAEADVLFFGPEFITRLEPIVPKFSHRRMLLSWWTTRTRPPSTTPPAPPASPRPSCSGTGPCPRPPAWRPSTTPPATRTCSCAAGRCC